MRLVCPRCGAQYEIDDAAVPAAGRDVECSACDHVWRATRPDAPFDAAARPALSRPLSESVIEILREEAARELETRAAERQAARAAARLAERGETAGSPLVGLGDLDDPAERVAAAGGVGAGAAGPGTGGSGTGGHGASVSERSADPGFSSVPEPTAARGLPAPATATAYTGAPAEARLADMPDVEADPFGLHPAGQPTTEQGAPSAAQSGAAADATAPAATSPASVPPTSVPPASSPSAPVPPPALSAAHSVDPAASQSAASFGPLPSVQAAPLPPGPESRRLGLPHVGSQPTSGPTASAARARRRHDAGYHIAVMAALVAVALYALAPRLADQGALGARLMAWRAQVDEGRDWLDQRATAAVDRLRGLVD